LANITVLNEDAGSLLTIGCMKISFFGKIIFSKGRMLLAMKNCSVCAKGLDLVSMQIAFFFKTEMQFKLA
jgi:hypothetical protein